MTIEQTVEIPADGWFHLDLPPELAGISGKVVVTAPLVPAAEMERRARAREAVECCAGIAKRMGFTGSSDDLLAERRTDRESGDEKIHLTSQMIDEMMRGETLRSLTGILHTGLTGEEIRAERLSKYDCID